MKIYTKTGDMGETGLFGGQRVKKTHPRTSAYGEIDELNAHLGLVAAQLEEGPTGIEATDAQGAATDVHDQVVAMVHTIQATLLTIGSHIATPYNTDDIPGTLPRWTDAPIDQLEEWIDALQQELPELQNFILPGGTVAGATLHVARTVCRRAERSLLQAMETEELLPDFLRYINRLSDLLFVVARTVNYTAGSTETEWRPE